MEFRFIPERRLQRSLRFLKKKVHKSGIKREAFEMSGQENWKERI